MDLGNEEETRLFHTWASSQRADYTSLHRLVTGIGSPNQEAASANHAIASRVWKPEDCKPYLPNMSTETLSDCGQHGRSSSTENPDCVVEQSQFATTNGWGKCIY